MRVREGPRSGQCGIVLTRAVLCAEGVRGSVTTQELDASGLVAIVDEEQHHLVQLDESNEPVRLSPYAVELWAHIGQSVGMLPGPPNDVFSVLQDFRGGQLSILVSRRLFALRAHVCAMAGGELFVGAWARLLLPHPYAPSVVGGPADPPLEIAWRPTVWWSACPLWLDQVAALRLLTK